MKSITVLGRKGGIGKTTTAIALAYGLSDRGYKVLVIDTDSQANLTEIMLKDPPGYSLNDLLTDSEPDMERALIEVDGDLHLIASDPESESLAIMDRMELEESPELFSILLDHYSDRFDFCIIDTPADMGFFTQAAMAASDSLILPMLADRHSLSGLDKFLRTFEYIRDTFNPGLEIEGLLITRYLDRGRLNQEIKEAIIEMGKEAGVTVFTNPIHETIKQKEADALGISVFKHCPRNRIIDDYNSLIDEILENPDDKKE